MRVAHHVTVGLREGRASYAGLHTCQSVWECAVCAAAIKGERAQEVTRTVELWRSMGGSVYMVTFTVRHQRLHRGGGQTLEDLHDGLMQAYKRLQQGREWQGFRRACGGLETVRAVEVTYGANGPHPHLHVLLLSPRPIDHPELLRWLEERGEAGATEWLYERWRACVLSELGNACEPSREHGVDVRACKRAEYISKLGLEVTNPSDSKRGGASPFGLLERASKGDEAAAELWREYVRHMHGRRFLGWSHGLRGWRALALRSVEPEPEPEPFAVVSANDWDRIRDIPRARVSLLEAAEVSREELWRKLDYWRRAADYHEGGTENGPDG